VTSALQRAYNRSCIPGAYFSDKREVSRFSRYSRGKGSRIEQSERTSKRLCPTNWSGNYNYSTDKVLQPASVAETQDAVRSVTGVRALGTRHAFNDIADSQIAQISTLKLRDISLDSNAPTVTVGAGIRYGNLAAVLDARAMNSITWHLYRTSRLAEPASP
jgi:hypothetical protein